MIGTIRQLRMAIGAHPEGLAAQQRHQAVTIPAAHAAAEQAVLETFDSTERALLREACASLARALWARIPAGTNLVEYGRTDEGWHTIEQIVNGIVLSHQPVCSR